MRLPALRQFALSQPGATVIKQWGEHLVFKVAGKMFLIIGLDGETIDGVTFKCTPDAEFDELTEVDGITQAPYCAKRTGCASRTCWRSRQRNSSDAFDGATISWSRSCPGKPGRSWDFPVEVRS